jgi:thiol-disulfide isomerase/thioredoxin
MATEARPDALLLLTTTCPHCPKVLASLAELVKQGVIGRLEVVNITARPAVARKFGVRSVPWMKIGEFELQGLYTPAELRQWAERAGSFDGLGEYFHELLKSGQLDQVTAQVARGGHPLKVLIRLLGDADTELTVRIGVNAVVESLEGQPVLAEAVAPLIELARHRESHVRGDAAHLLSYTHQPEARPLLKTLLKDENADVREIATEGLERLNAHG